MITVADRDALRMSAGGTARYEGIEHGAEASFFWVESTPGSGPDLHVHPYTETWVVLSGRVEIQVDGEVLTAGRGAIVTAGADTPHRFTSIGPGALEMICIHASPTIEQTFLELEPIRTHTSIRR